MPRPKPVRPKRSIELSLYCEDLDWVEEMRRARRLHGSPSEIVSQAIYELRQRLDPSATPA